MWLSNRCKGFCDHTAGNEASGFGPRRGWCSECEAYWDALCGLADKLDREECGFQQVERQPAGTYFIRSEDYVKIGGTKGSSIYGNGPVSRLSTLQVGNPHELTLLAFIPGLDEEEARDRFKHLLVRGEWHRLTAEVLAFISAEAREKQEQAAAQPPASEARSAERN